MSNSKNEIDSILDERTGVSTLTLANAPDNVLNMDMLTNIANELTTLEANENVKGVLVTSKYHGDTFISGLNTFDMYNQTDEHVTRYWKALQKLHITILGFSKPIVAAINGNAIAGGCGFVLPCDYRVMVAGGNIGVPESQYGIVAPFFYYDAMEALVGHRQCELALLEGKYYVSEEALKIRLVDEVVELDQVIPRALAKLQELIKIPQPAYKLTKRLLREDMISKFERKREEDVTSTVALIQQPFAQKAFESIIKLFGLTNRA